MSALFRYALPEYPSTSFKQAGSEGDVVRLLQDSLSKWAAHEGEHRAYLCRPEDIRDGEHVNELAFAITSARIESIGPQEILERLDALFAHACCRLTELGSGTNPES